MIGYIRLLVSVKRHGGWASALAYVRSDMITHVIEWENVPAKTRAMIYMSDGTEYLTTMSVDEVMTAIKGE